MILGVEESLNLSLEELSKWKYRLGSTGCNQRDGIDQKDGDVCTTWRLVTLHASQPRPCLH